MSNALAAERCPAAADPAGEHVAGAGAGERGVAGGVDPRVVPSAAADDVPEPLRTITDAQARRQLARRAAGDRPARSPSCCRAGAPLRADAASGSSRGRGARAPPASASSEGSAAIALSASASRTRRAATESSLGSARADRIAAAAAADDGRRGEHGGVALGPGAPEHQLGADRIDLASDASFMPARSPTRSTNTRPAPAACAARAASQAAPAMPGAPPTTATSPKLPLWLGVPSGRDGARRVARCRPATRRRCSSGRSTPSRAHHDPSGVIAPAAGEEAGLRRDQRQRVVGADARRAERLAAIDVEPRGDVDGEDARAERRKVGDAADRGSDRALGRTRRADAEQRIDDEIGSIASDRFVGVEVADVDAGLARRARAPDSRPRAASPTTPTRSTVVGLPQSHRRVAASMPSPPLLPGPAKTTMRRACGARASARRATASPARAMSVKGGNAASASPSILRVAATPSSAIRPMAPSMRSTLLIS